MNSLPRAALTSGYVFRVENQATVAYLQEVGKTGNLVTLSVEDDGKRGFNLFWTALFGPNDSILAFLLLMTTRLMTIASITVLAVMRDWWGFSLLLSLVLSRILNIYLVRRRAKLSWHGALEPGVKGDLLILLSQDRWVQIKGSVDALKTVTSGQWLTDMTFFEGCLDAIGTMIVYVTAALVSNASQTGILIFIALLLLSVALLGVSNEQAKALYVQGNIIKTIGKPKAYARRLDLAKEVIKESKRDDWTVGLGMINRGDSGKGSSSSAIML